MRWLVFWLVFLSIYLSFLWSVCETKPMFFIFPTIFSSYPILQFFFYIFLQICIFSFFNIFSFWRFPIFIPFSRYTTTWLTKKRKKNTKSIFDRERLVMYIYIYICIDHKRTVRGVTFFLLWLGRHTTVVTKREESKWKWKESRKKKKTKNVRIIITITTI